MGLIISYVCEHTHASLISLLGFELKEQTQKTKKRRGLRPWRFFDAG